MGKIKYLKKVREFFRKTPIVTISSLKKIIKKDNGYIYLMLNNMVCSGEIYRITRGMYSIYNDPVISVFCFKPSYLGLQEALSVHNLWEQETNTVILTTKTVREGIRVVFDNNIIIRRIKSKYFFGFEYKKYGDFYVPVSDIEKTLIDLVYFCQPLDREVVHNFRTKLNMKKLQIYIKRYDSSTAEKVLAVINGKQKHILRKSKLK